MKKVLVFAGTTEGRILSKKIFDAGFDVSVSVASSYGSELLLSSFELDSKSPRFHFFHKRLSQNEMEKLFPEFDFIIDGTHPYAVEVSRNIRSACVSCKKKYFRFLRNLDSEKKAEFKKSSFLEFNSIEEIAEFLIQEDEKTLAQRKSLPKIFVSTGSKELFPFTKLSDYKSRVFVRILPSVESLQKCIELDFPKKNIIAMQGPFSVEMNEAMFRETKSSFLVTKESGKIGGFDEKIIAAEKCGMKILAVRIPTETSENVYSDMDQLLEEMEK